MKVYVESKTNKVFFSVTHMTKRFYVYTGLQTTEKFSGMMFPKSDKSAKAKTRRLAELYAKCESYILDHYDESPDMMKEHLKEICTGAKKEDKSPFLSFMKAFAETRERPNTRRSYERTYRCVEAYDGKCSFNTITKDWLEGFIRHEMNKGRKANGISTTSHTSRQYSRRPSMMVRRRTFRSTISSSKRRKPGSAVCHWSR